MRPAFAPLLLAFVVSVVPSHARIIEAATTQGKTSAKNGACAGSEIRFDSSSIEAIILHPEEILKDVDAFWQRDRAYWLVSRWLDDVGYERPISAWVPLIEKNAQVPPENRSADTLIAIVRKLMAGEKDFHRIRDSPHLFIHT